MNDLEKICADAYEARVKIGTLDTDIKNKVLNDAADNLLKAEKEILEANKRDVATAEENMKAKSMIDRLSLDHDRLLGMADGLRQIAKLADPIGEVMSMAKRPNGLIIGKRRVAIGVVGIIFEARPNVTSDAFGLCFKTGNCVILKGGSDAINTNIAIKKALTDNLVSAAALALIESTDRETTNAFMKMDQYVDVLIPRGGAGLIQNVVKNATIPVIQTGTGNCHVYVDKDADFDMAVNIINNAKTQRISVCNACESIVVHSAIAEEFLPKLYDKLREHHVQLHCDERAQAILAGRDDVTEATADDWGMEYLDYIMSVKIVDSIDEAIEHINRYNTSHSEAIITNDYDNAQKFLNEIDAACVYVNASTRFSDGNEFGFGAEIGISTQKLHARGPMGLEALTSYKYIIYGSGQIRE
jgi:glutamate-5-semialdehyde dehydrogenase